MIIQLYSYNNANTNANTNTNTNTKGYYIITTNILII